MPYMTMIKEENIMEFILKNPTLLLGVVVLFAILVALCILWLLPALIKRGVDVSGTIEKADLAISALDSLTDTIKALFPKGHLHSSKSTIHLCLCKNP